MQTRLLSLRQSQRYITKKGCESEFHFENQGSDNFKIEVAAGVEALQLEGLAQDNTIKYRLIAATYRTVGIEP
jgi:hypothetical protein